MAFIRQASSVDPRLQRLRPGRNGFGHEHPDGHRQVAEIQRARILAAIVELAAERGVSGVTIARIVAGSGVSRRTFYELFKDREDCFVAAFQQAVERASRYVREVIDPRASWAARIRASLIALLSFLDAEPFMARLLIVESLGAGPRALQRRSRVLAILIAAVDEGRREAKGGPEPAPLSAEGVVGAVLSVLHTRLLQKNPGRLVELTNPFMGMIVLPYLGAAAASRELARPVPKPETIVSKPPGMSDPLRELGIRLTYRTVMVLMAVAAHPGSSNRMVADEAGISDQGQISKLLRRLEGLDLIEIAGEEPAPGGPNAWTLTEKGRGLHDTIGEKTTRG